MGYSRLVALPAAAATDPKINRKFIFIRFARFWLAVCRRCYRHHYYCRRRRRNLGTQTVQRTAWQPSIIYTHGQAGRQIGSNDFGWLRPTRVDSRNHRAAKWKQPCARLALLRLSRARNAAAAQRQRLIKNRRAIIISSSHRAPPLSMNRAARINEPEPSGVVMKWTRLSVISATISRCITAARVKLCCTFERHEDKERGADRAGGRMTLRVATRESPQLSSCCCCRRKSRRH